MADDKWDWRGESTQASATNAVEGILGHCCGLGGLMVVAFIAPVGGGRHETATAVGGGASNRQLALQLVARLSASREESQARIAAERQKQEAPPRNPAV